MRKPARAFTIPEMAVSMFLLSFITMLSLGVLFPGLQTVRQAEEATVTQQQITLAFDRLFAELQEVDPGSITTFGNGLVFLSQRPYHGSAPTLSASTIQASGFLTETNWTKFVLIRHNGNVVEMFEYPYAGGNELARIDPTQVGNVLALPGYAPRIWVRYAEIFEVAQPSTNLINFRMQTVSRDARGVEATEMTFKVGLRRIL